MNGIRSSVTSVWKIIHPKEIPIAEQPLIAEFFAAKRKTEIFIPKAEQLMTWDTDLLVQYINQTWPIDSNITLHNLQLKSLILLCMVTMGRPRSDLGHLQYKHLHISLDNKQQVTSSILHFTEAKETQVETIQLGVIKETTMCPVTTLYKFLQRTSKIRLQLPEDHTLFLTYLDQDKPSTSIRPTTVANWVLSIMKKAGCNGVRPLRRYIQP